MLFTLILGIAAGAAAPFLEEQVKRGLENIVLADAPLTAPELRGATLALLLFGAAVFAWLFGGGSAIALTLGGVIGVASPRIISRIQNRRAPDYGEDP